MLPYGPRYYVRVERINDPSQAFGDVEADEEEDYESWHHNYLNEGRARHGGKLET